MATINHKRNFIVTLRNDEGIPVIDHEQKASLLWESFKKRLNVSEFSSIQYDLSNLLTVTNLDHLDLDFSPEEIEMVVKNLPNSHAPGLDGFNGLFIKKY